ncbi:MAG: hypothetical protein AAFR55_08535, partial [Pseudomonadota bacterium]
STAFADGARLKIAGDVTPSTAQPTARLQGTVRARTPAAARTLAGVLRAAWPAATPTASLCGSGPACPPAELSFVADIGRQDTGQLNLAVDGRVGRDDVGLALTSASAPGALMTEPMRVSLDAELTDAQGVLLIAERLGLRRVSKGARTRSLASDGTRAHLSVTAEGVARERLTTTLHVVRAREQIAYAGHLSFADVAAVALDGRVRVTQGRAGTLAHLAGLTRLNTAAADLVIDGTFGVSGTTARTTWTIDSARVGTTDVRGTIDVAARAPDVASGGATRGSEGALTKTIRGALAFSQIDLQAVLPTILARPANGATLLTPQQAPAAPSVWSQVPFDPQQLTGLDIKVTTRVASLAIAPGNTIADARFKFEAGPKQIALASVRGRTALNGSLTANMILTAAAAGYRLDGDVELAGLDLAQFGDAAAPQTTGTAKLALKFGGEGLSPRALVGLMGGTGKLSLADVTVRGIDPSGVRRVAARSIATPAGEAGEQGDGGTTAGPLAEALRPALLENTFDVGSVDLDVTVRDGAVLVPRFRVRNDVGTASNVTTVDLSSLVAESRWRVAPRRNADEPRALPPVEIIYAGALAALQRTAPIIEADGLARELVVRRMERSVAELERLRREEAERRAAEAEPSADDVNQLVPGPELVPGLGSGNAPVLRSPLQPARRSDRRSDRGAISPARRTARADARQSVAARARAARLRLFGTGSITRVPGGVFGAPARRSALGGPVPALPVRRQERGSATASPANNVDAATGSAGQTERAANRRQRNSTASRRATSAAVRRARRSRLRPRPRRSARQQQRRNSKRARRARREAWRRKLFFSN